MSDLPKKLREHATWLESRSFAELDGSLDRLAAEEIERLRERADVLAFLEREDVIVERIFFHCGSREGWNVRVRHKKWHFQGIEKNVVSAAKTAMLAEAKYLKAAEAEGE